MNFELAGKLYPLVESDKLDQAIILAETELKNIPITSFHQIIGRNFLHLIPDLKNYIENFDYSTTIHFNKKQSILKKLLGKESKPAAYYCEMNGFTINYDRWFIDLFSYEKFSLDDWEWLVDSCDMTEKDLTITGMEDIQNIFQDIHENDRFKEPNISEAYDICDLLIILRLQELFRETYKAGNDKWTKIPMFVTAHDCDMIYTPNADYKAAHNTR